MEEYYIVWHCPARRAGYVTDDKRDAEAKRDEMQRNGRTCPMSTYERKVMTGVVGVENLIHKEHH